MCARRILFSITLFTILPLAGKHAAAECGPNPPGFEVTWQTDANVLKNKLISGTLPAGVTITGVSITPAPAAIGQDQTIGATTTPSI